MKIKSILGIISAVLLLLIGANSCTVADSSEVALVVDQIGNNKGVPNIEVASGFIFYFPPTLQVFQQESAISED